MGGSEDCAVMLDLLEFDWADYPCGSQLQSFLCEGVDDRSAPADPSTVKASIDLYSESDIHEFSLGNYAQVLMSAVSRSLTARTMDEVRSMRVTSIFKMAPALLRGAARRGLADDHAPLASGARFTLEVEMSAPEHALACDNELMSAVYTGTLVERVKAWYPNVIGAALPRSVRMGDGDDLSRRGTRVIFGGDGAALSRARAPALAASDWCLSACEVHITNAPPPPLVPAAPPRKAAKKKTNGAEITGIVVGVIGAVLVSLLAVVALSVRRSKQRPRREFEFAKHGSPYDPPYCNSNNALFVDASGRVGGPDAFCAGYGVHTVLNPLSAPGVPVGAVPDSPVRCCASADAMP